MRGCAGYGLRKSVFRFLQKNIYLVRCALGLLGPEFDTASCDSACSGMDGIVHEMTLGRERELELRQRRLERGGEFRRESERVERRQPGCFSKLLYFLFRLTRESFCDKSLSPATEHSAHFAQLFREKNIFIV